MTKCHLSPYFLFPTIKEIGPSLTDQGTLCIQHSLEKYSFEPGKLRLRQDSPIFIADPFCVGNYFIETYCSVIPAASFIYKFLRHKLFFHFFHNTSSFLFYFYIFLMYYTEILYKYIYRLYGLKNMRTNDIHHKSSYFIYVKNYYFIKITVSNHFS